MIDALIESGVRDFVLSPGSRSAPLALALADREVLGLVRLHVRMDERSAGFFALGVAKGSDKPVGLICTSGSAVANLHPAVVEADYSAVPLLLLTADRPAELRAVGASQTIKQARIFGDSVRWFVDVAAPETGDVAEAASWSELAAQAVDRACDQRGPVHLNLAFRAPLVGDIQAWAFGLSATSESDSNAGESGGTSDAEPDQRLGQDVAPNHEQELSSGQGPTPQMWNQKELSQNAQLRPGAMPEQGVELGDDQLCSGDFGRASRKRGHGGQDSQGENWPSPITVGRGVLVVGDLPLPPPGLNDLSHDILLLAEALGWPVIAEPTANLEPHPNLLSHGSLLTDCAEFVAEHRPDLVISVGRFGLSRAVTSLVTSARQHWALAVDGRGESADPGRSADRILTSLPGISVASGSNLGADLGLDTLSVKAGEVSPGVSLRTRGNSPASLDASTDPPESAWLTAWLAADRAVSRVVRQKILGSVESTDVVSSTSREVVGDVGFSVGDTDDPSRASGTLPDGLSGAGAALAVWDSLVPGEAVFLAASWSIRFIDSLAGRGAADRVLANRGANGIDGILSTTLGIATATGAREAILDGPCTSRSGGAGVPLDHAVESRMRNVNAARPEPGEADRPSGMVVAVLGDVAFLHDIGGLVGAGEMAVDAILVILNNNGGGIFSQLEQGAPGYERDFERVFGTPHGQDLVAIATSMGVSACDVRDLPELQGALTHAREAGGVHVLVVHTLDRRLEAARLAGIATASAAAISEIRR